MKQSLLIVTAVALLAASFVSSEAGHARPVETERDAASHEYQVKIDNFSFTPAILTVPAGATVTWVNQDDVPHTVVSSEGQVLKSPVLDTDNKFTYTFTKPGTYPYFCSVHSRMTGKVVVQ